MTELGWETPHPSAVFCVGVEHTKPVLCLHIWLVFPLLLKLSLCAVAMIIPLSSANPICYVELIVLSKCQHHDTLHTVGVILTPSLAILLVMDPIIPSCVPVLISCKVSWASPRTLQTVATNNDFMFER